jgi:hypothetical protein
VDAELQSLLETIERSFGVTFHAGELSDDSRLDDLYRAVRSHLGPRATDQCFTSIVFWRLRKACVQLFGVPKRSLAPWTALDLVLPSLHRRKAWHRLSEVSGLKLPALEFSQGLCLVVFAASFVPTVALAFATGNGWWIFATLFTGPVLSMLLLALLKPLAQSLPDQGLILGNTVKTAVGLNYGKLAVEFGPSRDSELAEAIRYVISDVTDVDPSEFREGNPRLLDLVDDNWRAGI